MRCTNCGGDMVLLLFSRVCANECDKWNHRPDSPKKDSNFVEGGEFDPWLYSFAYDKKSIISHCLSFNMQDVLNYRIDNGRSLYPVYKVRRSAIKKSTHDNGKLHISDAIGRVSVFWPEYYQEVDEGKIEVIHE